MIESILPKTYLTGFPCDRLQPEGVLDGRPLEIEVNTDHREKFPVRVISAGEVLWTMTAKDARNLALHLHNAGLAV